MSVARDLLNRQFGSLRVYNYRVYFLGQLVSVAGTWMQTTGQAWLVLKLTDSPLALGTVTTLQFLPITLLTLFGGVFADRWPKRRMLLITQVAALGQALALGILVATGSVELWHVYLLALCLGLVNAFDGPVRQAFAVELVGREQLVNAVALNSSLFNVARILGPAIGGVAIALVGMSSTFFINAASYVAVIVAYLAMRPAQFYRLPAKARPPGNVFQQIGQGVSYACRTPQIAFLLIMLSVLGTFGFNVTVVVPLLAEFVLHASPERFGVLTSCIGIGSLVAALALAAFGRITMRLLVADALIFALLLGSLALSRSYLLTAGLLVLFGVVSVTFSTSVNTSLQLLAPDEMRGRVMSIFFLLMAGSTPIGGYITGYLAEEIGVATTLAIESILCLAGVGAAIAYRVTRGRAGAPAEPAPATASAPVGRA